MSEYGKSCCFTGHRPQKLPWGYNELDPRCIAFKAKLAAVIKAVYESGIKHFICGMALGCDMYCAEAVIELRKSFDDITLEAAVPFAGQSERWGAAQRQRYESLLARCDAVTVLQEYYSPGCMMKRNRYMVDHADLVIACYDGQSGGTLNTLRYAIERGIQIVHLPLENEQER